MTTESYPAASALPTSKLLRGRQIALAKICREFYAHGWLVLAEHQPELPREFVADLRKALTVVHRIESDCT